MRRLHCAAGSGRAWLATGVRSALPLLLLNLLLIVPGVSLSANPTADSIREELGISERLSCNLRKSSPMLLFDFRIHSPYQVTLAAKELRESQELFMRIWTLPLKDQNGNAFAQPKQAHQLGDRFRLEDFPLAKRADLQVSGSVAMGPGEYRHFLAVDDGHGLGCVMEWKVKAKADNEIYHALSLQPGEVTDPRSMIFSRQQRVQKLPDGLNVAIFVNADNRSWRRSITDGSNVVAISASVRKLAEDERVRNVAVTMFSLEDQRVLYDQGYAPSLNFRRLGASIRQLRPGSVDLSALEAKSEARFFGNIVSERDERIREADLLVFIGARSPVSDKAPPPTVEAVLATRPRATAYLITNPFRWRNRVGRDVVGHLVKDLKGKEREIHVPKELAKAVDAILDEALERKQSVSRTE